jgi:ORF6N domain
VDNIFDLKIKNIAYNVYFTSVLNKNIRTIMSQLIPNEEIIASHIYTIRNQKVMFDFDLAGIYGLETKMLKRAVKRHIERFPEDFMFELTTEEFQNLRYQFGTSSWGGSRYPPFAFTEHGAVMLASILNSETAVKASLFVVRTFVKLRQLTGSYKELAEKIVQLEGKYDTQLEYVFQAIQELSEQKNEPRTLIGFKKEEK